MARQTAEKQQKQKTQRILQLKDKIVHERRAQDEIEQKVTRSRLMKEESEAKKLKNAYERMLAFERER